MRAASWIGFSFMYLAIFSFLLVITQQGEFPSITAGELVNRFVVITLASAVIGIGVALAAGTASEHVGFPPVAGGSAASASVKVAIYAAAVVFVTLWAVWIGGLLVGLMPVGMPGWMSIIFIAPVLVPTVWAIVAEFMGHKT